MARACARAISRILLAFQGTDDAKIPRNFTKHYRNPEEFGDGLAVGLLDQLKMADKQPIDAADRYYSKQAKLYPRIGAGLGDLMERLK